MGFFPFDAVASGVTTLANVFMNERNNKMNAEQNQVNREFQHNENVLSREFLSNEAKVAREWNTPKNQRALYESAGLNPYLASPQIGSAAVAPSSAPSAAAPSAIPMQASKFSPLLGLSDLVQVDNLRSQSSDNRAAAFEKLVSAIPTIAKYLGPDAVREMMSEYLPQITHNRYESSQESRITERMIRRADLDYELQDFEYGLQQKYGEDMTYRKLLNLEQEAAQSVTYVGLMNSLYRLNESNIEVNDAKIEELIKEAYQHWMHGNYMSAKTMTENESRIFFLGQLAQQVMAADMDLQEQSAAFEENELVRKYKKTKTGKYAAVSGYGLEHNIPTNIIDYVLERGSKALGVRNQSLFRPQSPATPIWQKVKHKATRPTYSGKESVEWYTDY